MARLSFASPLSVSGSPVVLLLIALFFVGSSPFASGLKLPTPLAIDRCANIGISSGCSGCEATTTGCEWCSRPGDDTYAPGLGSNCAPKGFCDRIVEPLNRDWKYVSNGKLCEGDPLTTIRYLKVSDASLETSFGSAVETEELRNGQFNSNLCAFGNKTHTVDRFSKVYGDAISGCRTANDLLSVGTRANLASCSGVTLTTLSHKDEACIKLYQSFACTSRCWNYGEPMNFNALCSDICERRDQFCRPALLSCLRSNSPLLNFDCKPKGDTNCYQPTLIEASVVFEAKLCINSDLSKCPEDPNPDCGLSQLAKYPVGVEEYLYTNYFRSTIANDHPQYTVPSNIASPACRTNNFGDYSLSAFSYGVTKQPKKSGIQCQDVLDAKMHQIVAALRTSGYSVDGIVSGHDSSFGSGCYDQNGDGLLDFCMGFFYHSSVKSACPSGYAVAPNYFYPAPFILSYPSYFPPNTVGINSHK